MSSGLNLERPPADCRVVVAMSGGVDSSCTAALLVAAGYEVVQGRRFVLDLQARMGSGNYKDIGANVSAGSIGVGLSWY